MHLPNETMLCYACSKKKLIEFSFVKQKLSPDHVTCLVLACIMSVCLSVEMNRCFVVH